MWNLGVGPVSHSERGMSSRLAPLLYLRVASQHLKAFTFATPHGKSSFSPPIMAIFSTNYKCMQSKNVVPSASTNSGVSRYHSLWFWARHCWLWNGRSHNSARWTTGDERRRHHVKTLAKEHGYAISIVRNKMTGRKLHSSVREVLYMACSRSGNHRQRVIDSNTYSSSKISCPFQL